MTQSRRRGFTLVELNLAIVFVALLLMAVATTIIAVSRTYQYGVSLKTVNQLGREVIDQMRRDISASDPARAEYYYTDLGSNRGVGRLCLGSVSYVFNSAALINAGGSSPVKDSTNRNRIIALARIDDKEGQWCQRDASDKFAKTALGAGDVYTEMLQDDIIAIAVHSMDMTTLLESEGAYSEKLVNVSLVIGTNETQTTDGGVCKPPTSASENFSNCAVREFTTIVPVIGGS